MTVQSPQNSKFINVRTIYTSILGALLAFTIGKLLDPLFEKVYSAFLSLGGTFIKTISDSTYYKISNGFSDQTASLLFILGFCRLLRVFIKPSHLNHKFVFPKHKQLEEVTNISSESNFSSDNEETISISELEERVSDMNHELNFLRNELCSLNERTNKLISKRKHTYKVTYIFSLCVTISAFIFLLFLYSRNSYITNKITLLTNNIEIVSPYISDQEYKQLKSDFHSIQNADDYKALNDTLIAISHSASIQLKE